MDETRFKEFLEHKNYTLKSVSSRMSRARKSEQMLGYDLDEAVSSDAKMRDSLIKLRDYDNREENYQNAVRSYYEFRNGKAFSKLDE